MNFFEIQIFEIINLQIKIEQMFNLARMLTTLKCCHLQMENMDWIIIVMKDWLGCKPSLNLKYFKTKNLLQSKIITWLKGITFLKKMQVDND
jgi:hypothetical protein